MNGPLKYQKGFPDPAVPAHVEHPIIDIGKSIGFEVICQDVEELVDEHREQLTIEELQDLYQEIK